MVYGMRWMLSLVSMGLLGCARTLEAHQTDWYACGPAPAKGTSHCASFGGHFLQLIDEASGERRVFVDGRLVPVQRMSGGRYWSTNCAYQDFATLQEAAVCNVEQTPP
jgi:hypothetical protein